MARMKLEFDGKVAVLSFNHPEVLNAIGSQMIDDLTDALFEVQKPANGARCLLLTGEGRAFCAGANLQDSSKTDRPSNAGLRLRSGYHPILLTLKNLDIPIVTAVNGAAAGVGMSFAIIGDLVCASRQAFFLQAFARIGLVPDGGSTFMLPRLVGWARAAELSMLAERLPAERALEWGLINRLYEDNDALMDGALGLARQLANGPMSLGLTRKLYWQSYSNSFESQLDLEANTQTIAQSSADSAEGAAAFLEKRDARFTGR
jgi:2-(1,2-epoxy-1,2-dihydrophenyl)acetyl-CoA isomerase